MVMQTYRDSRAKAADAAEAIRAALVSLGIPESVWGTIRPVVAHKGSSYVHLGVVRADAAKKMAEAMRPD
ncbi:hypothetical protein [Streptomyces sp. GbtcB7]|uniref:hypothetical protein n=1 Tax=Streptomyces sp. GbtcB7 TaxID=2824752 RepID=UPI001C2F6521|nr:hypothetical protein [Streptomyces sp. GbtcB7]